MAKQYCYVSISHDEEFYGAVVVVADTHDQAIEEVERRLGTSSHADYLSAAVPYGTVLPDGVLNCLLQLEEIVKIFGPCMAYNQDGEAVARVTEEDLKREIN